MERRIFERLRQQLTIYEGVRSHPYLCSAGRLTVGVGRNLEDNGISQSEAEYLLDNDIQRCWDQVIEVLPWSRSVPLVIQEVLVHMCFNLGIEGLLGFKKTLAAMQAGEWGQAAHEMRASRWARQVGTRAENLAAAVEALRVSSSEQLEKIQLIRAQLDALEKVVENLCIES